MSSLRSNNMQGLLQLFFWFVLLAKASCLECETCNSNSSTCTGPKQNCTDGDTCAIMIVKSSLVEIPEYTFNKGCGDPASCDATQSHVYFDLGNGQTYHLKQYCCTEEECSKITPTLPPLEKDPKGKRCPACNTREDQCSHETVECSGQDTDCFTIVINSTSNGKFIQQIMKGCGSKNICTVLEKNKETITGDFKDEVKCVFPPASQAPQVLASFLITFSSFWILKLLV